MAVRNGICALWCCLLGAGGAFAQFAGGNGTSSTPYLISTPEHLDRVRDYCGAGNANVYFALKNDIDLSDYIRTPNTCGSFGGAGNHSGKGWQPIGTADNPFCARFDGGYFIISGLWIKRPAEDNIGLFGYTSNAIIEKTGIEVVTWDTLKGRTNVGALVGRAVGGSIKRCYSQGSTVEGYSNVGGVAGHISGIAPYSFDQNYTSINVRGRTATGGLTGRMINSTITNSYAVSASVASFIAAASYPDTLGGLVGYAQGSALINCFAACRTIAEGAFSGCVAGVINSTTFTGCYFNNNYCTNPVGRFDGATPQIQGIGLYRMVEKAYFPAFDFVGVWRICESRSYPYFEWQKSVPPRAWYGSHTLPPPSNQVIHGLHFQTLVPADSFTYFTGKDLNDPDEAVSMWTMCDSRGCNASGYEVEFAMNVWTFQGEPSTGTYYAFTLKYENCPLPAAAPLKWLSQRKPQANARADSIEYGYIIPQMRTLTTSAISEGDTMKGDPLYYPINNGVTAYSNPLPWNTLLNAGSYVISADTCSIRIFDKNGADVSRFYNLPPKVMPNILYVKQRQGEVSVNMDAYIGYGSPTPASTSNSGGAVTYLYKPCNMTSDAAYSTAPPNSKGCYTIKANLAATTNYTDAWDTISFFLTSMQALEVEHPNSYVGCLDSPKVVFNSLAPIPPDYQYKRCTAPESAYSPVKPSEAGCWMLLASVTSPDTTITASVDFMVEDKEAGSLVIRQSDEVYGKPLPPCVVLLNNSGGNVHYRYKPADSSDLHYDTLPPTAAGRYTIWGTLDATCQYTESYDRMTFEIRKARSKLVIEQDTGYYDRLPPPRVADCGAIQGDSCGAVTFDYKPQNDPAAAYLPSIASAAPQGEVYYQVGAYALRGILAATPNYTPDTAEIKFVVVKAKGKLVFEQADGYFNSLLPAPVVTQNNSCNYGNVCGGVTFYYKPHDVPDVYFEEGYPTNAGAYIRRGIVEATANYEEGITDVFFEIIDTICLSQSTLIIWRYWEKLLLVNLNVNTNGGLTFPRRWYKWTRNALPLAEPPTPYFYLEHIPQTGDRYMLYAIAAERADTVKACLLITEHPEPPPVPAAEVQNWAYPNPVGAGGRHITIEPQGSQPIEIYSTGGLKVREYPASAPKTTIDVTGLPAGAYMVRQGSRTAVVVVQ